MMIQGVLSELPPKKEAVEAQGNFEEEGSSSTPEDIEDENAALKIKFSLFHLSIQKSLQPSQGVKIPLRSRRVNGGEASRRRLS